MPRNKSAPFTVKRDVELQRIRDEQSKTYRENFEHVFKNLMPEAFNQFFHPSNPIPVRDTRAASLPETPAPAQPIVPDPACRCRQNGLAQCPLHAPMCVENDGTRARRPIEVVEPFFRMILASKGIHPLREAVSQDRMKDLCVHYARIRMDTDTVALLTVPGSQNSWNALSEVTAQLEEGIEALINLHPDMSEPYAVFENNKVAHADYVTDSILMTVCCYHDKNKCQYEQRENVIVSFRTDWMGQNGRPTRVNVSSPAIANEETRQIAIRAAAVRRAREEQERERRLAQDAQRIHDAQQLLASSGFQVLSQPQDAPEDTSSPDRFKPKRKIEV